MSETPKLSRKENIMQAVSEKQNEVATEGFIADSALIDSTMVHKKSVWDIANESLPTFTTFF